MTSTTDQAGVGVDVRQLIAPDLFDRLASGIAQTHGLPDAQGERIMEQTLAFLYACTAMPGAALTPSPQVDLGWHAFVLHTREYADFCHKLAGRFIHHVPDEPGVVDRDGRLQQLGATMAAMRKAGVRVDADLWLLPAECSQCYAGCVDDPAPTGGQHR